MAENTHQRLMMAALLEAKKAELNGEVPVGAIVVNKNDIIARGHNQVISANDPTAHAEIVALREAAKQQKNYRLSDCQIYVTLEPCMMCLGAMVHARVEHLYFAALEPKAGVVCSHMGLHEASFLNHKLKISHDLLAKESSNLLSHFFKRKRLAKK